MYTATIEQLVMNATVITRTLLIHSTHTIVLLDSISIQKFIAKTFFIRINLIVEDLGYDFIVSTPSRAILTIGECVKDVTIVIQ